MLLLQLKKNLILMKVSHQAIHAVAFAPLEAPYLSPLGRHLLYLSLAVSGHNPLAQEATSMFHTHHLYNLRMIRRTSFHSQANSSIYQDETPTEVYGIRQQAFENLG